jgi:uncharacterized membrane protein (UPF0127 family)
LARVVEIRHRNGTLCARCLVARNAFQRMKGLLGRASLPRDEGILFPRTSSIHMLFMRFAIDVVFLDGASRVLKVVPALPPWRFAACRGAKTTLELAAGACAELGVGPGDELEIVEV